MGLASTVIIMVLAASAVAMLVRRLKLPYTVALVLAGLGLSQLQGLLPGFEGEQLRLTPDLLFPVFLPALLFEAAFHLSYSDFRRNLRAIALLAVPGVLLAVVLTGAIVYVLEPFVDATLPLGASLLFASMLAATDPVSVIAIFKELGVPKRLAVLMEGESLLNDGTAVATFVVIVAVMGIGTEQVHVNAGWILRFIAVELVGGVLIGVGVGLAASWLTSLIDDHLIEITLSTIAAYGSYVLADAAHASGVLAVVAAGMACGNVGVRYGMSPTTRIAVVSFWEYAVFVANSFVFLLIGKEIALDRLVRHVPGILVAWAALTVGRALVVLAAERALSRSEERLPRKWAAVLTWGGLRGGLSMVLALSLPSTLALRPLLIDLTFGVVLVSIIVQGLSIGPLLRWAGVVQGGRNRFEYTRLRGSLRSTRDALRALDEAHARQEMHQSTYDAVREKLTARIAQAETALDAFGVDAEAIRGEEIRVVEQKLRAVERDAIKHAASSGVLTDDVARALLREIDERELEGDPSAPGPRAAASATAEAPAELPATAEQAEPGGAIAPATDTAAGPSEEGQ